MTVYWCDPFLHASSQGAGTTDTSTQNGTYAAPFSLLNFHSLSSSTYSTVNGVSLSNGDEIRLKGLSFSTLFNDLGDSYFYGEANYSYAKPISGNTTWASNYDSNVDIFAMSGADCADFKPDPDSTSQPLVFRTFHANDSHSSSQFRAYYNNGMYPIFAGLEAKYGSSQSGTPKHIYQLKSAYYWSGDSTTNATDYHYYFFLSTSLEILLTSGWDSETTQNGISLWVWDGSKSSSSANQTYWFSGSSAPAGKIIQDWRKCHIATGLSYLGRIGFMGDNSTNGTPHSSNDNGIGTWFASGLYFSYISIGSNTYYSSSDNDRTYKIGALVEGPLYNYKYFRNRGNLYINLHSVQAAITAFQGAFTYSTTRDYFNFFIGSIFCGRYQKASSYGYHIANFSSATIATPTLIDNAVLFIRSNNDNFPGLTFGDHGIESTSKVTIASGATVSIPGLGVLTGDNSFYNHSTYSHFEPNVTGVNGLLANLSPASLSTTLLSALVLAPTNFGESVSSPELNCGGSNYKSTASNLLVQASQTYTNANPLVATVNFEHNDYDGKPIMLLASDTGLKGGVLCYNDTISSVDCLVVQHSGTVGSHQFGLLPLELQTPTYTAGSNNLRVTMSAAKSANYGTASGTIYYIHRDSSESDGTDHGNGAFTITSTDTGSPTTVTTNITTVPASGDELNSIFVILKVDFANDTDIEQLYITNIAVETYT
tara:strand:+ start:2096 stop:4225 length:2130 start_codon:yes stop_codon:yes gene_type:complete